MIKRSFKEHWASLPGVWENSNTDGFFAKASDRTWETVIITQTQISSECKMWCSGVKQTQLSLDGHFLGESDDNTHLCKPSQHSRGLNCLPYGCGGETAWSSSPARAVEKFAVWFPYQASSMDEIQWQQCIISGKVLLLQTSFILAAWPMG